MNDNTLNTAEITISAAGVRLRELAPHVQSLESAIMAPDTDEEARDRAIRALAVLSVEDEALRDYVTATLAVTVEDALVQIDAIALEVEAMASEGDPEFHYKRLARRMFRVLASNAGFLSKMAGKGLDEFTTTGLDQTFKVAFPLAARSAFATAELL